jgi:hypothetical protein
MEVAHEKPSTMGGEKPHMGALPTMVGHPLAPYMGGPTSHQTCLNKTRMFPSQKATKQADHDSWDLVPSRWDKMFFRVYSSEKFWKVPKHFRHPLKLLWTRSKTFSV